MCKTNSGAWGLRLCGLYFNLLRLCASVLRIRHLDVVSASGPPGAASSFCAAGAAPSSSGLLTFHSRACSEGGQNPGSRIGSRSVFFMVRRAYVLIVPSFYCFAFCTVHLKIVGGDSPAVDQALEMLGVALVTILAREIRLKFFQVDQALEMLQVPVVTIFAREMRLKFFLSRPSFGDVASDASHDIGVRDAIEIKATNVWRCCEWRYPRYWREKCN